MNLQLEIKQLKKELDKIEDESLIQAIKSLLSFAKKRDYELHLKPMTIEEYKARIESSENDIKEGRVINIEDLKKESENW